MSQGCRLACGHYLVPCSPQQDSCFLPPFSTGVKCKAQPQPPTPPVPHPSPGALPLEAEYSAKPVAEATSLRLLPVGRPGTSSDRGVQASSEAPAPVMRRQWVRRGAQEVRTVLSHTQDKGKASEALSTAEVAEARLEELLVVLI